MRNNKGISLIVLVVTIIVMIIIAGAIIITLTQSNIISQAEEATFKTQVRAIQDALSLKKANMLADNVGNIETYNISLNDLGLSDEDFNKFNPKLTIDNRGDLLYKKDGVTAQEERWLIELGIKAQSTIGSNFPADVQTLYTVTATTGYNNSRDYYTMLEQIKDAYPDVVVLSRRPNTNRFLPAGMYTDIYKFCYNEERTIAMLNEKYPQGGSITAAIEAEVRAILGTEADYPTMTNQITNLIDGFFADTSTVSGLITEIDEHLQTKSGIDDIVNYVIINDGESVKITNTSVESDVANLEGVVIMTAAQVAEAGITYTAANGMAQITGYTGNSQEITIPSVIVDGDMAFLVVEVADNAFKNTKPFKQDIVPMFLDGVMQNIFERNYSDVTFEEIQSFAEENEMTIPEGKTYTDDLQGKNELVIDTLLPMILADMLPEGANPADYIITEGTGDNHKVYMLATFNSDGEIEAFYTNTTPGAAVISKITFAEGIENIGDNVLSGNIIDTVYIPSTLQEVSSTAFDSANISKVQSRLTWEELIALDSSAASGIFDSTCEQDGFEHID